MDIVDVTIGGESLVYDYLCVINAVTITPLVKKQYLVDVPGADGSKDLSSWFGAPRFESRTLKIYCQCAAEPATDCADKMVSRWVGRTLDVVLSFDDMFYRTGMVTQVMPAGAGPSDEIVITILCEPCRYLCYEVIHRIPTSAEVREYTWWNNGTLDVLPTLTVPEDDITLLMGTAKFTLTAGTFLLPELVIPGNSSITVTVSGGALEARYREAVR